MSKHILRIKVTNSANHSKNTFEKGKRITKQCPNPKCKEEKRIVEVISDSERISNFLICVCIECGWWWYE